LLPTIERAPRPLATFLALGSLLILAPAPAPVVATPQPAEPAQATQVAVGDTASDFTLQSTDGETYRLSDLRGEKNAVIIFFRGTW